MVGFVKIEDNLTESKMLNRKLLTLLTENKKGLEEKMNLLISEIAKADKETEPSEIVPTSNEKGSSKKRNRSVLVAQDNQQTSPKKKQKKYGMF